MSQLDNGKESSLQPQSLLSGTCRMEGRAKFRAGFLPSPGLMGKHFGKPLKCSCLGCSCEKGQGRP